MRIISRLPLPRTEKQGTLTGLKIRYSPEKQLNPPFFLGLSFVTEK
jgi:hypothetical protein